jgi:hypothetical protein
MVDFFCWYSVVLTTKVAAQSARPVITVVMKKTPEAHLSGYQRLIRY